jgi:hypothetical protein
VNVMRNVRQAMLVFMVLGLTLFVADLAALAYGARCGKTQSVPCEKTASLIAVGDSRSRVEALVRTRFRKEFESPSETVYVCRGNAAGACGYMPLLMLRVTVRFDHERVASVSRGDEIVQRRFWSRAATTLVSNRAR